jgi:predicted nuclease of predicted toxin-antitoxin system
MKILLDENIPRQLKISLVMFETFMVKDMGWRGLKNGILLQKAQEEQFNVFITVDKNLRFQQNINGKHFFIIVLNIPLLKWQFIEPLVPSMVQLIANGEAGRVYVI